MAAILLHAVVAMLGGARSYEAMAQFGRDRGSAFGRAVGYTREDLPCKATFSNIFRGLSVDAFEKVLGQWTAGRQQAGWTKASLDGKTLCGSAGDQLPGVHLLAVFDHQAQAAIAQMSVDAKTNEHKKALELLDLMDIQDKTITGDAMFCQRDLSKKIVKKKAIISGRSKRISRD